jgi:hypothetical protein
MGQGQTTLGGEYRHQGGSHPFELGVCLCGGKNFSIRTGYDLSEFFGQAEGRTLQRLSGSNGDLGRELAGHLPGAMPAHAVCDQVQAQIRDQRVAIFIYAPTHAHICSRARL